MLFRVNVLAGFLGLVCLALPPSPAAEKEKEPLVDQVKKAIDRGVQYLRDKEDGRGHWEVDPASATRQGGWSSLAMLALLNSGVKPTDPIIERGLKYLRELKPEHTYVVGLQTMVFAAAGKAEDKSRLQDNVQWLVNARVMDEKNLLGWTYGKGGPKTLGADNSNTQYALLGLHDAHLAGAKIDREVWESIRQFYINTQQKAPGAPPVGGWGYSPAAQQPTLTMTTAGLCGLIIAGLELNEGREVFQADGTAAGCGDYKENPEITRAIGWVGKHYHIATPRGFLYPAVYYNIYGIERAGRLTGMRFLGSHDWYREGCQFLVGAQNREGYWVGEGHDRWPVISTSFALLFLSKGRTPVLVSKLVHGPGNDWNNDRNDVRNLVHFTSKELFKNTPLAWQIFDAKKARIDNRQDLLNLAGDLLQSPVAYFNGHEAPEFNDSEKDLLKEYIEQGGFLFAEACCGKANFDRGFRKLVSDLFPDSDLIKLPPEHPIWRSYFLIKPDEFELYGIERGCKTVVVYSPKDLSCYWESNKFAGGKNQQAFRVGANIVAYATGMELPRPRLTEVEVVAGKEDPKKIPRGYLKVVQLRHEGDWQPAPRAMRNLMAYLKDKPRLDVALQTEALHPSNTGILDFKFMYMHGRAEFNYTTKAAFDNLRSNLNTGGLLFADACCGKKTFDNSFRAFIAKLFPDNKLEQIPLNDELFGKELNGASIASVRCRRDDAEGKAEANFRDVPPFLEGIKINNRWVVIYSKYDLGCALEKHQSTDCLGHDYPSALKLASAAVLYALKR